jgi:hypothetical protein
MTDLAFETDMEESRSYMMSFKHSIAQQILPYFSESFRWRAGTLGQAKPVLNVVLLGLPTIVFVGLAHAIQHLAHDHERDIEFCGVPLSMMFTLATLLLWAISGALSAGLFITVPWRNIKMAALSASLGWLLMNCFLIPLIT